jgi:hypothetical protein
MRPGEELALGERPWEGTAPPRDHGILANPPAFPLSAAVPATGRAGTHASYLTLRAGVCGLIPQAAHSRQTGWPLRSSASWLR